VTVPGASVTVSDWSDVGEGVVVEARVTGHNTGGLECEVNHIRGFIPMSQISLHRVENAEDYVGQKLACVVTEANEQRGNLVLSHRAILEREQEANREQLFGQLEVGQVHTATIRKLMDFGAFAEIAPGVDGLIHISQLSWDRVNHPNEVLTEGQKVEVKIEKIDPNTRKIGLSYRELQDNPWNNVARKFIPGSVVSGAVSRVAQFGAFVKLEPGVEGLVHISELAHYRVQRASSVVQEGQEVEVKVLEVDEEKQRISLSMKATHQPPAEETKPEAEDDTPEEPRELAVGRRKGPLKGGMNKKSGGESLGLNW
jgi:small subunit ribosomal protein S1